MEEKYNKNINESFFKLNSNYEKTKDNMINQSTELLQTEEIFINQKEEIKKIKRKQFLELKAFKQDNIAKTTNLKCIQILKRGKNFNTYNKMNTEIINKQPERKTMKSNSINTRMIGDRKKKFMTNNNNKIKRVKLKLEDDFRKINNINKFKIKISNINSNNITNNEEETIINNDNDISLNFENEINYISLDNLNLFQACDCLINDNCSDLINNNDEIPKINEKWTFLKNTNINNLRRNIINTNSSRISEIPIPNILNNNFDFSKKVLLTKNYLDYNNKGVKINLNLKIYDQGTFWIFTRCYVDNYYKEEIKKFKTINTDYVSNDNNNKNNIFSKYSTVIKIFKNQNSNKGFVSFGTFYVNRKSGNLHYKNFLQRQLVDFVQEDNDYYYLENDLCEFNIIIVDLGKEYLQAKISLNNKEKYNNIKSSFYLPLNKKAKLMFCGEGNKIKVSELEIRSFIKYDEDKDRIGLIISDEQNNCDCCQIF